MEEKSKIKPVMIISIMILLTLIVFTVLSSVMKNRELNAASGKVNPTTEMPSSEAAPVPGQQMYAIYMGASEDMVHVFDLGTEVDCEFRFTGALDVRDSYGKVIPLGKLRKGDIIKLESENKDGKVNKIQLPPEAWEYKYVSNLMIDPAIQKMTIKENIYRYTDGLLVLSDDKQVALSDLDKVDMLNIRGIDHTISVIQVVKGHGYLTLEDDGDFIGGSITVGAGAVTQITKNMRMTVPEGEYEVSVTSGKLKGTRTVRINRDQTSIFNIGEYGNSPVQMGRVRFHILPSTSELFIDGVKTNYAAPLELPYGEHHIEVSLGGYTTYNGSIDVMRTDNVFTVNLIASGEGMEEEDGTYATTDFAGNDNDDYDYDNDGGGQNGTDSPDNTSEDDPIEPTTEEELSEEEEEPAPTPVPEVQTTRPANENLLIKIQCTNGAEVLVNGISKGLINNGEVSFKKVIGVIEIVLKKEGYLTKRYTVEVEDNQDDVTFRFPDMVKE